MQDESIDMTSVPATSGDRDAGRTRQPFLGIHFACCGIYTRIYVNASGSAFAGNCPGCGGQIVVRISPDGETDRFFSVY